MSYYKNIIGNKAGYKKLDAALNKKTKNIILCGKSGCGKSTFVNAFIKHKKLSKVEYDINDIDKIDLEFLYKKTIVPKVVVFENIIYDMNNSSKLDTKIKKLIDPIEKNTSNIIFIISNKKSKLFSKFKTSTLFNFRLPKKDTIISHIEKTLTEKHEVNEKYLSIISKQVYEKNDGNLSNILVDVEIIKQTSQNGKIKYTKDLKLFLDKSMRDETYDNINDVFNKLFKPNDENPEKLYEYDNFLVPNAVYSNYLDGKKSKDLDNVVESLDQMTSYDIFFDQKHLGMNKYLSYMGVVAPMFYSGEIKKNIGFPYNIGKDSSILKLKRDSKAREAKQLKLGFFS